MMTKVCEKCDHEMRLVPAGISKSKNKPYSAFWSCDARNGGCGATARAEGEAAQPAPDYNGAVVPGNDRFAAIEEKLDQLIAMVKELQGL
jgi:hypothetical protein